MALVPVDNNIYTPGTSPQTITVVGTGSLRGILVITTALRASDRTLTGITLDGVSGTVHANFNVAGAFDALTSVSWFSDAQNPGAGPFALDTAWSGSVPNSITHEVLEYTGMHQTTPLSALATNGANDVADAGAIQVTLNSQSGEYAVTYLVSADVNTGSGGNHVVSAAATELNDDPLNDLRTAVAADAVVASSAETYTWTVSHNGTDAADSVAAVAFAVFAAEAGNPTVVLVSPVSGDGYIDAIPELATDDTLEYEAVTTPSGYAVTVNTDASIEIDGGWDGESFDVRAHDGVSWGDWATQTLEVTPVSSAYSGYNCKISCGIGIGI